MTATRPESAPAPTYAASGWLQAAGNVVAAGILNVAYGVGQQWGVHPIAFVLYAIVASAIGMLAVPGFGPDTLAIARHPLTWVVGISIILIETLFYVTLAYVSPAHGNLVVRLGIPIAMLFGFVLFRRRSPPLAVAAAAVIVGSVAFVVAITEPDARWPMAIAGTLTGLFMVTRSFAAEFHPYNRAAKDVRAKLQVTGTVVLVTSGVALASVSAIALATAAGIVPRMHYVPTAADLVDGRTVLLGTLLGGSLLTLMAYLNFSSVVKIGTANHTAILAFSPVASWFFQELAVVAGLLTVTRPDARLAGAMAVIVGAVLLMLWAGRRSDLRIARDSLTGRGKRDRR